MYVSYHDAGLGCEVESLIIARVRVVSTSRIGIQDACGVNPSIWVVSITIKGNAHQNDPVQINLTSSTAAIVSAYITPNNQYDKSRSVDSLPPTSKNPIPSNTQVPTDLVVVDLAGRAVFLPAWALAA